jgi:hypothetical protein
MMKIQATAWQTFENAAAPHPHAHDFLENKHACMNGPELSLATQFYQ